MIHSSEITISGKILRRTFVYVRNVHY